MVKKNLRGFYPIIIKHLFDSLLYTFVIHHYDKGQVRVIGVS